MKEESWFLHSKFFFFFSFSIKNTTVIMMMILLTALLLGQKPLVKGETLRYGEICQERHQEHVPPHPPRHAAPHL